MAEATARPRPVRPRRPSTLPFLLLVLGCLALLWGLYWYGAREVSGALLDRSLARLGEAGIAAECEAPISGGFPLSLDLACATTRLSSHAHGLSASITGFSARTPLYWPGRVEMDYRGPLVFTASVPLIEAAAEWTDAGTVIDAGIGGLQSFAVDIVDLAIKLRHDIPGLALSALATPEARLSLSPSKTDRAYRLSATVEALAMDTFDGRELPEVDFSIGAEALDFGSALGTNPRQTLRNWIGRGGRFQVEQLEMTAQGFSFAAAGPLQISPEGLISGTLTVRMSGLDALPEIVEAFRPGSRDRVANLAAGVVAFTKPVQTSEGPAQEATLLLRDGVVSLGIFPIGAIPPIRF